MQFRHTIVIAVIVLIAAFEGFIAGGTMLQTKPEQSLAATALIDTESRKAYQNGEINKETAVKRISEHLNTLLAAENIESWEYNETSSEYKVLLNDGTKFVYRLN